MKGMAALILLYYVGKVESAEPASKTCFANQELRFFCIWKLYKEAKKACEDDNSYLVKIDNANMTKVVNDLIDKAGCQYIDVFIGATATPDKDFPNDGNKRIWRWLDGSKVYLPDESGYQNWRYNQPNDMGGREDCLMIDKRTKQWMDGNCNERGEEKYYICQNILEAKFDLKINAIPNAKQCMATAGICSTHTEWRRGSTIVSNQRNLPVYQTSSDNSSILHYKNATIGEAGEYICAAWIENDKENSTLTSINISVNGTPVIEELKPYTCNTSLRLIWKTHHPALGYQHRIKAVESFTGKLVKVIVIIPYEEKQYFTEIAGLEPFTEYRIKVVACKDIDICTDEYTAMKSATTLSKVVTVTNATIQQYNGVCNVTWQWHDSLTETFQINTYLGLRSTPNGSISKQTLFTKNNHYWFPSLSGQEYTVEIQPLTNETYCSKPVIAVGSCIGKDSPVASKLTLIVLVVILSIIVFFMSLVIVSMAILLRKRATKIVQQTQTNESRDVHDYATVRNPEINGADYLDLTDNSAAQINTAASATKASYENIDQSLSPTYETVNNKPVSEYEM